MAEDSCCGSFFGESVVEFKWDTLTLNLGCDLSFFFSHSSFWEYFWNFISCYRARIALGLHGRCLGKDEAFVSEFLSPNTVAKF